MQCSARSLAVVTGQSSGLLWALQMALPALNLGT